MKAQLEKTLQISRDYTLTVAEAMPEESYGFKPSEVVWSFKELLNHIAYGIQWWEENHVKGKQTEWAPPLDKETKAAVIDYLRHAYYSLEKTINSVELTDESVNWFYATLDHITHHRGQAITYLRCQEIASPEYTY